MTQQDSATFAGSTGATDSLMMRQATARAVLIHRLTAFGVGLTFLAPLVIASMLTPAHGGVGTHTKLGLPPCTFYAMTGHPCATCGMTTAFAHAAQGDLLQSLQTQPAGALLALVCGAMALVAAWAMYRGTSLAPMLEWVMQPRTLIVTISIVSLAWIYKLIVMW